MTEALKTSAFKPMCKSLPAHVISTSQKFILSKYSSSDANYSSFGTSVSDVSDMVDRTRDSVLTKNGVKSGSREKNSLKNPLMSYLKKGITKEGTRHSQFDRSRSKSSDARK